MVKVWEIVLLVALVWVALSVVTALLIGAMIRLRDRREATRTQDTTGPHAVVGAGRVRRRE